MLNHQNNYVGHSNDARILKLFATFINTTFLYSYLFWWCNKIIFRFVSS